MKIIFMIKMIYSINYWWEGLTHLLVLGNNLNNNNCNKNISNTPKHNYRGHLDSFLIDLLKWLNLKELNAANSDDWFTVVNSIL